ncbi:Carboxylic ester hydrolase [Ophiocordyceps camponoti-floridani]|uniref:Carboxylic ester hydrolase n=1 Tax=Ophiocordyceps camponoti-floridani TaxID=2030778 RepID=A0A8H4QED8_9HYPO|nr:Carboxylic ester hydrolase [Ophiocordyceps camponoti-floridani]
MSSSETVVSINGGNIIGRHQSPSADRPQALDVFHDIVYARTPTRFQPAEAIPPVSPGETVRADRCPGPSQPQVLAEGIRQEGDVRLHVMRTCRCSDGKLLPVVVYLHGGGFNFGGPLERDFGGAGAHSIGHHLVSPLPLPLPVRKAILESGAPTARSVLSAAHPRPVGQLASLRRHLGASYLSQAPLDALLSAAGSVWAENATAVTWPFQPVVDGNLIPDLPCRLVRGVSDGVALLTGFCSHEGAGFLERGEDFKAFFGNLIPGIDMVGLEELYPADMMTTTVTRAQLAYGDYAYIAPVLHTACCLARAGARVYVYEYSAAAAPLSAASHGDHMAVSACEADMLRGRPGLAAVGSAMAERWTAFAARE